MRTISKPKYIFPPRAVSGAITIDKVSAHEKFGWKAQPKFNDMHLCLSYESGEVNLLTRHNSKHKRYNTPDFLLEEIEEMMDKLGLDKSAWSYLDGGVLHHKHAYFQDHLVIWDILVRENQHLVGTTYRERYEWLLSKLGGEPFYIELNGEKFQVGIKITEHIFVPVFFETAQECWDMVQAVNEAAGWKNEGEPLLEGLMLKQPDGVLKPGRREHNNEDWMTRCRVRTGRHRQ